MVKVLILTHGNLAGSLDETLGLFLNDRKGLESIGLDVDTERFKALVRKAIIDSPEKEILVMIDLFGGTPFNVVASLLSQAKANGKRVEVITGVNLPMILEVVPKIDICSLEELKTTAFEMGKYGIRDLLSELNKRT
jgi:PTS system mannose-specific IIA component